MTDYLDVERYRTLENITLTFPHSYSAICGRNDSGKTNVLKAIEMLFGGEEEFPRYYRTIRARTDFTRWRENESGPRSIQVSALLQVDKHQDAGLFEFLTTYLALENEAGTLQLKITLTFGEKIPIARPTVEISGEKYTDIKAEEILKKLQSSPCLLQYNSTEPDFPYLSRRSSSVLSRDFSPEYANLMDSVKEQVDKRLADIAEAQQNELSQLLGRLQEKYPLRLALPEFDPGTVPVDITLGTKGYEIPLGEWGSGTRNRTRILLTLFRAKQISESAKSAAKITPIIVIEEPESFLHPSAQAEFGRVLQDISEEFNVQVIVATHSPYLLSLSKPDSNILLEREISEGVPKATHRTDTLGESWMQPFALALGVDNTEFKPWKQLFSSESSSILLVEGETDKEYLEILRDESHGENRLNFQGEIFSYDGCGTLKNTVLLRFIKNRYSKVFITYDLDAESQVESTLKSLGLSKGRDYLGIGKEGPSEKNIEALVPLVIKTQVYSEHPELVDQMMGTDKSESEKAKRELKQLYFHKFREMSTPGDELYYGDFYSLSRQLNECFSNG